MSMTIRALVAAAIVAGIFAGARMLDGGGIPTTSTPPQQDLDDLPRQLGDWQGEDLPDMDVELSHTVSVLNRQYTNSAGKTVTLHATVSVFSSSWRLPHVPLKCYKSGGHTILATKIVEIELPDGQEIPAKLMTVELEGRRSYVFYWYHVGDRIVHDQREMQYAAWTMRGKDAWPPVLKLMLTNAAPDEYQAIYQFESIAGPLAEWACEFR